MPMNVKLGKAPARHDKRTLRLASYIDRTTLAEAPPAQDWSQAVSAPWPMMGNDSAGDCTCACAGHMVQCWSANAAGDAVIIPDADILAAYSAISGYDPSTGANDDGAVVLDVLNYWRNVGVGGHQIGAYVAVNPHVVDEVRLATYLFGGVYLGVLLPVSAQAQTDAGGPWDVPAGGPFGDGAPGSWGGHAVPAVAYDGEQLKVVTWGQLLPVTWRFLNTYCDECYAILSQDWLADGQAPSGFDMDQLQADLGQLGA